MGHLRIDQNIGQAPRAFDEMEMLQKY
jgi:hypothetical protein